ncbi:MAG: DUF3822 family protein [Paludibacteraceae bacterium]|nr:DUF3822 family protein [Paludibacteraceae bacterium]
MQRKEIASILQPSFDINEQTISIRPRPGGFCFSLFDHKQGAYHALSEWTGMRNEEELRRAWEQTGLNGKNPQKAILFTDSERWTMIPNVLAKTDRNAAWKLAFGETSRHPLKEQPIDAAGATCLFESDNSTHTIWKELIPGIEEWPLQAADCTYILRKSIRIDQRITGVAIRPDHIDIYVCENGKLLLANRYTCDGDADIVYYVMNIYRLFKLSQAHTPIFIWGENIGKQTANILKTYIASVNYARPEGQYRLNNGIEKVDSLYNYIELFWNE